MADTLQSALDRVAAATTELRAATEALLAALPPSNVLGLFVPDNFATVSEQVIRTTAAVYQVAVEDLLSRNRRQPLCTARHVAITIVHELTGAATQTIAERFQLTDHASVCWAVDSIRTRRQNERVTRAAYAAIMARLATGS